MTFTRRKQSGGIILMVLVIIAMIALIFTLAWYAFNGGKRGSDTAPSTTEIVVPID